MASVTRCRSCNSSPLSPVLSLGRMPLANALLEEDQLLEPEETYPLGLTFCSHCALVQLTETVASEKLFREYVYFSSFSDTTLREASALANRLIARERLNPGSFVVEIGSNDGYLLRNYKKATIPILGIEPAANVARVAQKEHGIPTLCEFFSENIAEQLVQRGQTADVIHGHNVLAHTPDPNEMVRGMGRLLKEDGVTVIEVPYVKELIDGRQFDTIYHEHLSYFSLTALKNLFERHGMVINDVERLASHGGSLRLFVKTSGKESGAVKDLLREEIGWGVYDGGFYETFAQRIEELKQSLRALLIDLKQKGQRLAAYGAAAKGSTLLNYFQIGGELLDFVVDRSTYKQGRYLPGVRLPICAPEKLLEQMPGYVLLLTWNFADEIIAQQAEYRSQGGRFIIPIPELRMV